MNTLFKLKEKLSTVGAELEAVTTELMDKAGDANVPIDEVTALQTRKQNLQTRFDLIKDEHDRMDADQKTRIQAQAQKARENSGLQNANTDEARVIAAKAEFIRAKVLGHEISPEAKEILAVVTPLRALPAGGGTGGEKFLPKTTSTEVIHEPFVKNPLRGKIGQTAIKGLELPKIDFELDDDGFITDAETSKEIQATGDKVEFGKFKFKVKVRISDTVLHGSDIDLVAYVEKALASGLAAKEKKVSFVANAAAVAAEKHMSFYAEDAGGDTLIITVERDTMFRAIKAAIADLPEDFRENAQVCMKYIDYVDMLEALSQASVPLYGKTPEEVIGKPVFFSDAAVTPIVGDFRFYHCNYDPEMIYDSDKNVDAGEYIWVLTAWFDQKFKLYSAFRLAAVEGEL